METTEQVATSSQPPATIITTSDGTTQELEKHPSFLGYRPAIESHCGKTETSAETTATEQVENQPDTETTTTDETDDPNWLPEEQQKAFPDDVIAKYGEQYGYTAEQIQANPSLRTDEG